MVSNQKVTRKKRSAIKPLKVKLFALAREVSGGKREIELEFERKSAAADEEDFPGSAEQDI